MALVLAESQRYRQRQSIPLLELDKYVSVWLWNFCCCWKYCELSDTEWCLLGIMTTDWETEQVMWISLVGWSPIRLHWSHKHRQAYSCMLTRSGPRVLSAVNNQLMRFIMDDNLAATTCRSFYPVFPTSVTSGHKESTCLIKQHNNNTMCSSLLVINSASPLPEYEFPGDVGS